MPEGFDIATDDEIREWREEMKESDAKESYLRALKILGNKLCTERLKKLTNERIERLEEEYPHFKKLKASDKVKEPVKTKREIKRETKKKVKTDDMTKTQKSALTELRKIRRLKYITKEDFEMVKDKIENNKSVKLKYSKPDGTYRFSYKRIKGFGLSDDSDSDSDSDSDERPPINIEALMITPEDFKKLTSTDLIFRYNMIKSYVDSAVDMVIPELPEEIGNLTPSQFKAKIVKAIKKVFNEFPEINDILAESSKSMDIEGEGMTFEPLKRKSDPGYLIRKEREMNERLKERYNTGSVVPATGAGIKKRGRPKKSDSVHIDINSHNNEGSENLMKGEGFVESLKQQYQYIKPELKKLLKPIKKKLGIKEVKKYKPKAWNYDDMIKEDEISTHMKSKLMSGGALTDEDIVRLESLYMSMPKSKPQKLSLKDISKDDIKDLVKNLISVKEDLKTDKENIEFTRRAVKARIARENPKKKKVLTPEEKVNKAFGKVQSKRFKKGSQEAKDYMAAMRAKRKKL
jgi:hypothetical protein